MSRDERLRALPSVDRVMAALADDHADTFVARAARTAVDQARAAVVDGGPAPRFEDIVARARTVHARLGRSLLRPVINATGVIVHTNLGRVPLGPRQLEAIARIAGGYSNLEYDLESGERGSRYAHARALIQALTGAESALVVNNNAAAVLLVLAALCAGREVVISRGELIEIGGEFRIPDVMKTSGTVLTEIGTTNRTHLADYERAIGPNTAALMKVHPSNYRMVGFTSAVPSRELVRLARGRGVLFLHDLGSGLATDTDVAALRDEPLVDDALAEGADIVTFSGDKLFGGPQAGIVAGRADLIDSVARHPLIRALRVDKMTLAALEATLDAYLSNRRTELPLWRMLEQTEDELRNRAASIAESVNGMNNAKADVVPLEAVTGGGSAPGTGVRSWGIGVSHPERSADELNRALRLGDPPVIGRIENDTVVLDLRTVRPEDDELLVANVVRALDEVAR